MASVRPLSVYLLIFYAIIVAKGFIIKNLISGNCDTNNQCPSGYTCRYLSVMPGSRACLLTSLTNANTGTVQTKRPGRCPISFALDNTLATNGKCDGHADCPTAQRCCPLTLGGDSYCLNPVTLNTAPVVVPIVVGFQLQTGAAFNQSGSVTLVQSNGFNVLVDTGSPGVNLLQGLWDNARLVQEDIDFVVNSHGHPDHYGNVQMFANVQQAKNIFQFRGQIYSLNALANNQTYLVNNDRNLEIQLTPGHTLQDLTLIVRNVPGFGTVSVVGDLIGSRDETSDTSAESATLSTQNRRRIACLSNWVVPGHGPMFQMDQTLRTRYGC